MNLSNTVFYKPFLTWINMDDCHSSATVRSTFQTLLCMDTKKIAMILSNITFLLLFLQDIGGILEMWAAQGSHSLFNLPTSSPRSRSRFQLGKTAWFLHLSLEGEAICIAPVTWTNFPHWQWPSLWECIANYTGREKPPDIHACHSTHRAPPGLSFCSSTSRSGNISCIKQQEALSGKGHDWVSYVYNPSLLNTLMN